MMRWLVRIVVCLLMWLASGLVSSAELTWSVTGTFADGGTFSGTFVQDPTRILPSAWNLSVAGGGSSFPARTYTPADSIVFRLLFLSNTERTYVFRDSVGVRQLRLTPANALDGSVANVALSLANANAAVECFNCAPFRNITGGSLQLISAKPEVTLVSVVPDPTVVSAATIATVSIETVVALGPPTGTITVRDASSNTVCTITLPALSCTFAAPTVPGGQTLQAQYNGDAKYSSAMSNPLSYTVAPAVATTVTLVSVTPNPTTVGTLTTATATVATVPPLGQPTGTVAVLDGNQHSLCTIALPAPSCTFAPTTPGDQTVVAQYSGNASYASGSSNTLPLTVGPVVTDVTLVSVSPNPATVAATVTATISIATKPPFGPPTGMIAVLDGGSNMLCTITLPAVSCSFAAPTTPGAQTVVAQYEGDANYESVLSNTLPLTVEPAVPAVPVVTLASVAPNPATVGSTTTASVTITGIPALGLPTGTITVIDSGSTTLCTITLPAPSCDFAPTTPGQQTVHAQYSGDANYASASSNTLPLTVVAVTPGVPVVTLISVAPNPTKVGAMTTASVTVVGAAAPPTGTVAVHDATGNSLCTITLPAGSCSFAPTTEGALTVIAQYNGDANYTSATSNTLSLTVESADGSGTIAAIPALDRYALGVLALFLAALGLRRRPRR